MQCDHFNVHVHKYLMIEMMLQIILFMYGDFALEHLDWAIAYAHVHPLKQKDS